MLFVSHNLAVVRRISDRIAVMHDGVVVEEGRAEDLFARPEDAYTKLLLSSVPRLASRRIRAGGGRPA